LTEIDVKTTVDNFVAVITANVPDPLFSGDNVANVRDTGRFVEINKPHFHAKTPFVLVTLERIQVVNYEGTGSVNEDFNFRFEVRIKVAKNQEGYVSGTLYNGMVLLHNLATDIATHFKANAKTTTGIKVIRKEDAGGYFFDPVDENHIIVQYYLAEVVNQN
jgi:hypothetical protein